MKPLIVSIAAGLTGALALTFPWEGAATMVIAVTGLVTMLFVAIGNIVTRRQDRADRLALAKQIRDDALQAKAEAKEQAEELAHKIIADALQAKTEAKEQAERLMGKTEEIHGTTLQIHTATDGTLHLLQADKKVLEEEVTGLRALVASMVAGGKAQALAVTEAGRLTPPVETAAHAPAQAPVLQSIDQNTKKTAENTERTDRAVKDLKESK